MQLLTCGLVSSSPVISLSAGTQAGTNTISTPTTYNNAWKVDNLNQTDELVAKT